MGFMLVASPVDALQQLAILRIGHRSPASATFTESSVKSGEELMQWRVDQPYRDRLCPSISLKDGRRKSSRRLHRA
jgi:hypothetical protein